MTINITAKSKDDITKYIDGAGNSKTYNSGTKEITETYIATQNGTNTFTAKDSDGTTKTATVEITNIIGDEIQISGNPSTPTKGNVVVTVVWPSGSENGIKEIKVGEEDWKKVTGESNEITVTENCTVKARIKNSINEIKIARITIDDIDRQAPTAPTINGGSEEWATSRTISVSTESTDIGSGVAYYEYYVTTDSTTPTKTTTATGQVGTTEEEPQMLEINI